MITDDLKAQAAKIRDELNQLAELKEQAEKERKTAAQKREKLKDEQQTLKASMERRKKLKSQLASDYASEQENARKLAAKAKNLESLLESLDEAAKTPSKKHGQELTSEGEISGSRGSMRSFESAKGRIRIPVSGRVATGYGDLEGKNSTSKGVAMETGSNATVVAPYDGQVAYTGTFLNYGRMVILKHRGEYHTLLAGLGRIDVNVGDFLLEGEPIGAMASGKGRLYIELRKNSEPINPEGWIRGL
jgi:septal ring factor EnvC (AmiA/AmiB activator)